MWPIEQLYIELGAYMKHFKFVNWRIGFLMSRTGYRIHFLPIARSRYCRFEMGEMAATCSANLASGETVAFEASLERLSDEHVFLNDLE